jgi:phosphatidylserine/phosphatidylglycerophosphate/cardiolipin synthase-like enzyme
VRVYEDGRRMMHAKLAVFDDQLAVIGTSNLDHQSLDHSAEVNMVFEGPDVATWIREQFGPHIPGVVAIDSEGLSRRGILSRFVDRFAAYWFDS